MGRWLLVALLAAWGAGSVAQVDQVEPPADEQPLIEFSQYSLKLRDRDPTPQIRIYPSGRFLVYRASYRRDPGLFEATLSSTELDAITEAITSTGLQQADSLALAEAAEAAEIANRNLGGDLYYTSDSTISQLSLDLPRSAPGPLVFENLQDSARRNPSVVAVGDYALVERILLRLLNHPELQRIGDARNPWRAP